MTPLQQLIDQLTIIAPLLQRLHVTAKQQEHDAARALEAATRALATLDAVEPMRRRCL